MSAPTVLEILDALNLADPGQRPDLARARAEVVELIRRGRALQRRAGRNEWTQFAKALDAAAPLGGEV